MLLDMSGVNGKPETLLLDRLLVPPIPIRPSVGEAIGSKPTITGSHADGSLLIDSMLMDRMLMGRMPMGRMLMDPC